MQLKSSPSVGEQPTTIINQTQIIMIIDLILDRKDGQRYDAHDFYYNIMGYGEIWPNLADPITGAMDEGEEQDVKNALCAYIRNNDYNPAICDYINSVEWL